VKAQHFRPPLALTFGDGLGNSAGDRGVDAGVSEVDCAIHDQEPADGRGGQVSVTDTGVGIAPEDQEAVFEEFLQVGTAAKKVEGTGLGLTLCRKFVELHGGRIWVKSEVGVGSTFTFSVPL